ncbi:MAG: helix-turn-helix domain-containing protein [Ignavibacteriaceae bacterium]
MKVGFIDIILFVLFFQILSLTPFLLFNKQKKGLSNKILALFLFTKALCISNFISFRLFPYTLEYFPHAFWFGSSFTVLWGPGVYFYTRSLVNIDFKFKKKDFVHLIPFAAHFIYLLFAFHLYNAETKRHLILDQAVFSPIAVQIITGLIHLIIFSYLIASLLVILKYRSNIKNSFSSIKEINLSWMIFVLAGFSIKWSADVWMYFNGISGLSQEIPLIVSRLLLFLFINIVIYKGLKQPEIFSGIIEAKPVKRPFLSKSLEEKYLQKLSSFMEEKKPFLNPDVTLMDIAEQVKIPYRSLSEVINNSLNKNFYDFINNYRINESKKLLIEKSNRFKTILEVLYEVGYNSKSSFNNAFKKDTGMTPTEFKRVYGS